MQRSYLLSLKFKITSITRWVALLLENPLFAILSGFAFGNTPGIGTFYDFFSRLWISDSDHLSTKDRFPKPRAVKGAKKSDKTPADTETISSRLILLFQNHPMKPHHAFSLIFKLFQQQFLDHSVSLELIDSRHLALAGDGTPARTSTNLRRKRLCDFREKGIPSCRCKLMFVASGSHSDLPVSPLLEQSSLHDMPIFLHSFFTLKSYLPEFHLENCF